MKVLFATHNAHKVTEVLSLLSLPDLELVTLDQAGIAEDPEETGTTFLDNARIKARAARNVSPLPVLADDSGLEVRALNGEPGVRSKRFSPSATAEENNRLLLERLSGVTDRRARFVTALVYLDEYGHEHDFMGIANGSIGLAPQGTGGFGYDPLFISDEAGKAFGLLTLAEKDRYSHRAQAFRAFAVWFRDARS